MLEEAFSVPVAAADLDALKLMFVATVDVDDANE